MGKIRSKDALGENSYWSLDGSGKKPVDREYRPLCWDFEFLGNMDRMASRENGEQATDRMG